MTDFTKGCCCPFELDFLEDEEMELSFLEEEEMGLDFGEVIEVQHGYDPYEGPYEVTPLAHQEIILATKDKNMEDDVTVFEIPYQEVSNEHGTTVTIAS